MQGANERMRVLVQRALQLDNTLAEAWIMQSSSEWIEGNVAVADLARERALALGPENQMVLMESIWHNIWTRDPGPTRRLVTELVRVDPLSPESLRRASQFYARVGERARARELLDSKGCGRCDLPLHAIVVP